MTLELKNEYLLKSLHFTHQDCPLFLGLKVFVLPWAPSSTSESLQGIPDASPGRLVIKGFLLFPSGPCILSLPSHPCPSSGSCPSLLLLEHRWLSSALSHPFLG